MKRLTLFLLALLCAAIFWSCEKDKSGVIDPQLDTPRLLSASVNRTVFNLDSTDADITPLPGRQFKITCSVNALASSPYSPSAINKIAFKLLAPRSDASVLNGSLTNLTPGSLPAESTYWMKGSGNISFTIDYYAAGTYYLNLTAYDAANAASNTLALPIIVTRKDIKPQLFNLDVPDTVQIPASGLNIYRFTVAVSDSDGYSDINKVYFYSIDPLSTKPPYEMYDDGDQVNDGDLVAGDGIFSILVRLEPEPKNHPGTNLFLFRAQDLSGALSDSLTHLVTIVK
jgi:hypothetical protein